MPNRLSERAHQARMTAQLFGFNNTAAALGNIIHQERFREEVQQQRLSSFWSYRSLTQPLKSGP